MLDERGVDLDVAIAGVHEGGAVSALTASMTSVSPRTASIATDRGRIDLPADFHHPPYAVWTPLGGDPERIEGDEPVLGTGLGNEAAEVARCLAEGLRESPLVPHAADAAADGARWTTSAARWGFATPPTGEPRRPPPHLGWGA